MFTGVASSEGFPEPTGLQGPVTQWLMQFLEDVWSGVLMLLSLLDDSESKASRPGSGDKG